MGSFYYYGKYLTTMDSLDKITLKSFLAALLRLGSSLPKTYQKQLNDVSTNFLTDIDILDTLTEDYEPLEEEYLEARGILQNDGERFRSSTAETAPPAQISDDKLLNLVSEVLKAEDSINYIKRAYATSPELQMLLEELGYQRLESKKDKKINSKRLLYNAFPTAPFTLRIITKLSAHKSINAVIPGKSRFAKNTCSKLELNVISSLAGKGYIITVQVSKIIQELYVKTDIDRVALDKIIAEISSSSDKTSDVISSLQIYRYNIAGLVGKFCIDTEDGEKVYDLIHPKLLVGKPVELDFSGVETCVSSFLSFAVGHLLADIPREKLDSLLTVSNLNSVGMRSYNRVLRNFNRYYSIPDFHSRVSKVIDEFATSY